MFEEHLKNGNESINHTSANIYLSLLKPLTRKLYFSKKVRNNNPPSSLWNINCSIFPASSYPHSNCSPNRVTALIYINDNKITIFKLQQNIVKKLFCNVKANFAENIIKPKLFNPFLHDRTFLHFYFNIQNY